MASQHHSLATTHQHFSSKTNNRGSHKRRINQRKYIPSAVTALLSLAFSFLYPGCALPIGLHTRITHATKEVVGSSFLALILTFIPNPESSRALLRFACSNLTQSIQQSADHFQHEVFELCYSPLGHFVPSVVAGLDLVAISQLLPPRTDCYWSDVASPNNEKIEYECPSGTIEIIVSFVYRT